MRPRHTVLGVTGVMLRTQVRQHVHWNLQSWLALCPRSRLGPGGVHTYTELLCSWGHVPSPCWLCPGPRVTCRSGTSLYLVMCTAPLERTARHGRAWTRVRCARVNMGRGVHACKCKYMRDCAHVCESTGRCVCSLRLWVPAILWPHLPVSMWLGFSSMRCLPLLALRLGPAVPRTRAKG